MENGIEVPYLAAVPTTAGSGSEATCFAVVYNGKKKLSLQHDRLLPSNVLLDASLTSSLSNYQTAISGIDAFAQAIESFWNVNATEESKTYAAESIQILKEYLPKSLNNPGIQIREKLLWAAHLAGKAINITRTTGPHALSYYLTANFNVPHGQAVALFLPVFFLYNEENEELNKLLSVSNKENAFYYIRNLIKGIGLVTTFSELNIKIDEIWEDLVNEVNEERFKNNPAPFDKYRLKEICKHLK